MMSNSNKVSQFITSNLRLTETFNKMTESRSGEGSVIQTFDNDSTVRTVNNHEGARVRDNGMALSGMVLSENKNNNL